MHRLSTGVAALILCLHLAGPAAAQNKYAEYIKMSPTELFDVCVTKGDDTGCYFYGGLQKKRGQLQDAHDAFFLGAQLARDRAGFVCMLELARMYEAGEGTRKDAVQAYRWYTVLMTDQPAQDLRVAAAGKRQALASSMTAEQIAMAEAMAKSWKTQRGG